MNTVTPYYIGIDGGGTSCRARITDANGLILGEGKAGSANVFQNHELAWQSVQNAIALANQQAALSQQALQDSYIVAGLAGAEVTSCATQFKALIHGFPNFQLLTDAQIACLGAHGGQEGAIFIIGTGAIGISYRNGQWQQVGGWGFPLDDMGSGAWLGQQAIRAAINQHDGLITNSLLADMIWQHFDHLPEALISWSQHASSGNYGEFAPLVLNAFNQHDPVAVEIVQQQVTLLSRQIDALHTDGHPLCLMGGLADWVTVQLPERLQKIITPSQGDALSGALQFAKQRNQA